MVRRSPASPSYCQTIATRGMLGSFTRGILMPILIGNITKRSQIFTDSYSKKDGHGPVLVCSLLSTLAGCGWCLLAGFRSLSDKSTHEMVQYRRAHSLKHGCALLSSAN